MHLSSAVKATTCLPSDVAKTMGIFDQVGELLVELLDVTAVWPSILLSGDDSLIFFSGGAWSSDVAVEAEAAPWLVSTFWGHVARRWPLSAA